LRTSATISLVGRAPTGEVWPLPPPPESAYQLEFGPRLGATLDNASHTYREPWLKSGGDWRDAKGIVNGPDHWATAQAPGVGGEIKFEIAALVEELHENNRGIIVKRLTGGNVTFASTQHETAPRPRLTVVTDQATVECPCTLDVGFNQGLNNPDALPTLTHPFGMRFDLSGISGTVQSATLVLSATFISGTAPGLWAADLIWMPRIYTDPASEVGAIRYGIARDVQSEAELANHPSVLFFRQFPDVVSTWRNSDQWNNATNDSNAKYAIGGDGSGRDEFLFQPEYGTHALRVYSANAGGVTIVNRPHVLCPPGYGNPHGGDAAGPPRPFQFNFGEGPQELYLRYRLRIDPNLDNVAAQHVKIPGLDASFDQLTAVDPASGPPWPPGTRPFTQASAWSARLEHSANTFAPEKKANMSIHKLWVYLYSAGGNKLGSGSGSNEHTRGYLRGGVWYWLEQRIKLNTFSDVTQEWLRDGEMDVWVDGVLMLRRTDFLYRTSKYCEWFKLFMACQHGGTTPSNGQFHVDMGNFCVSTEYIGPGRILQ
jgi:hypothetical protein